jgi:hypothetical protein
VSRVADQPAQPLLEGERGGGAEHQERHDHLERAGRGEQQQRASGGGAQHAGGQDPGEAAALPAEVGPAAGHARHVPGKNGDRIGDVGRHRGQPGRDQAREGDQRPAAGDRVHAPGGEAGHHQQKDVCEIHGEVESTAP